MNVFSIKDLIVKTTQFFEVKHIECPRANAEWLCAHVLKCSRLELYLNYFEPVANETLEILRPLIKRRAKHEPLQYILGEVEFYGKIFQVDQRVLVPRPETEELIYQICEHCKNNPVQSILELGTGSGAIAVTLAQLFKDSLVTAIDISEDALALAKKNAQLNGVETKVHFLTGNWFENVQDKFDVIVSNPPYLSEEEWETSAVEVRDFEPKIALVAAEEGLQYLKLILSRGLCFLKPDGFIALETGIAHADALTKYAKELGYKRYYSTQDLCLRNRFFWAWK